MGEDPSSTAWYLIILYYRIGAIIFIKKRWTNESSSNSHPSSRKYTKQNKYSISSNYNWSTPPTTIQISSLISSPPNKHPSLPNISPNIYKISSPSINANSMSFSKDLTGPGRALFQGRILSMSLHPLVIKYWLIKGNRRDWLQLRFKAISSHWLCKSFKGWGLSRWAGSSWLRYSLTMPFCTLILSRLEA